MDREASPASIKTSAALKKQNIKWHLLSILNNWFYTVSLLLWNTLFKWFQQVHNYFQWEGEEIRDKWKQ